MQARARMDLSRWSDYPAQDRITFLGAIRAAITTRAMPPRRYTALHPDAVLSDAERNALYEWAGMERRRLRALATQK